MSNSLAFQAPAILTSFALTADGGIRLGFTTNELTEEEKVIAARFHRKFGHVLFRENQFTEDDVPDTDATDESKSPAQRLRGVLFILWKQKGSKADFESFYRSQMEAAINRVKRSLD